MNPNKNLTKSCKLYVCELCDYKCSNKTNYKKHCMTTKHQNATIPHEKVATTDVCNNCNYICYDKLNNDTQTLTPSNSIATSCKKVAIKSCKMFVCKKCDYKCSNKTNYEKHMMTQKHIKMINSVVLISENKLYKCEKCNKKYKHMSTLSAHKQKCAAELSDKNEEISNKELINYLKQTIIDLSKSAAQPISNIINNTTNNNINSHNKIFNLNFFLNDTCKNAINIQEFINSIEMQLSDLINVGKVGYVTGIADIINKNLKALDVTKRPVHCSDIKRETIYVKDNDIWEKETFENTKMRNVVKYVSHKNMGQLSEWKKENPNYLNQSSKTSNDYQILISKAGNYNDLNISTSESESKIIKNIVKEIVIDKKI
jgi:hypothetical protein